LRDHIYSCVLKLPEIYREIILLRYYEKSPYEQIAETLQINPGTVKSRLSAAREKMKEIIDTKYIL